MDKLRKLGAVPLSYALLASGSGVATEFATDVSVVTGVDFYHSVSLDSIGSGRMA